MRPGVSAGEFILGQFFRGLGIGFVGGQLYLLGAMLFGAVFINDLENNIVFFPAFLICGNIVGAGPVAIIAGFTAAVMAGAALLIKNPNSWNLAKLGAFFSLIVLAPIIYFWGSNSTFPGLFGVLYAWAIPFFILGLVFVATTISKRIPDHLKIGAIPTSYVNLATLLAIAVFSFSVARATLPWEVYEAHEMTWKIEATETRYPDCQPWVRLSFVTSPKRGVGVCSKSLVEYLRENTDETVLMELVAWNEDFYRYYSITKISDWRPGEETVFADIMSCWVECPPLPVNTRYSWKQKP